jgi:hypothetical protein
VKSQLPNDTKLRISANVVSISAVIRCDFFLIFLSALLETPSVDQRA